MSQVLYIKHSGIYSAPNEFSAIAQGALLKADNCSIDTENLLEPRRGNSRLIPFAAGTDRARRYTFYQNYPIAAYSGGKVARIGLFAVTNINTTTDTFTTAAHSYSNGDTVRFMSSGGLPGGISYGVDYYIINVAATTFKVSLVTSGSAVDVTSSGSGTVYVFRTAPTTSWTDYTGTYNDPDSTNARLRFLKVLNNLYLTSSTGVFRLDSATGTPVLSGMPEGLDINLTLVAGTFLATANQVAYRIIWGFVDANTTTFLGSPSGRAVITNSSGGARDVTVRATVPTGLSTSYFYQVYRSAASGSATIEPSDEMGLVKEAFLASADITNGYIEFTDSTTDSLRGATLYTSPSQEGISQSNDRPPLAEDIATFSNSTFYANTTSKHRLYLTLISAANMSNNDTVTLAGTVYTAKTAGETITSGFFQLFTAGTVAQNIADTAQSLVRVINRYTTNTTIYALYISGVNDLPGQMLLFERSLGGSSFAATQSSSNVQFDPALPTSGTTVSSSNEANPHQVFFSKSDKPEAVPLLNYLFVGAKNNEIRRIMPLGNSLFVFKEKEGIFRITGTSPSNFSVELFDSSARLLAPDSVAIVNNQIWCLTDQGITIVSETGASIVSRPIEDQLLDQIGTALPGVKQYSFGVGYETDRKYILWTVSTSTDTVPTQAFVYNVFTKAFTRWDITASTAEVSPDDDKLYIGQGNSEYTLQERKSFTYLDIVDRSFQVTISSTSGTTVNLTSTSGITVGDILTQGSLSSLITAIGGATQITVADNLAGWTAAGAVVYTAYESLAEYAPITGGNPGTSKQWPEVSFLFRSSRFNSATVGYATDVSGGFSDQTITGNRTGLWGLFPWGESLWGGVGVSLPIRTFPPTDKQRASLLRVRLKVRQGYSKWASNGLSVVMRELTAPYKVSR